MALVIDIDRAAGTLEVTSEDRVYIRDGSLGVTVNGFLAGDLGLAPWIQIYSCGRLMAEAEIQFGDEEGDGPFTGTCVIDTNTLPFARAFAGCTNETSRQFNVRVFSGDVENPKPIALGNMEVWNFPSVGGEPALLPTAHEIVKNLDEKIDEHVSRTDNPHGVTASQVGAIPASKERDFATVGDVSDIRRSVSEAFSDISQKQERLDDSLSSHISNTDNPHGVTKDTIGLGNVDNTRDLAKPVSILQEQYITNVQVNIMSSVMGMLLDYYRKDDGLLYTKEEVDQLISAIPKFKVEVVSALPETGFDNSTVYLVKTGDDGMNLFTEYIRVDNKWEQLGTQKLDLRNYATKFDLANDKNTLQQLIDLKQGKLSSKQVSVLDNGPYRPATWMPSAEDVGALTQSDVVPQGSGTEVIATIGGKDIKAPAGGSGDRISDSEGNVINADGTCTFKGAPWICDGIVLEVQSDGLWASEDRSIALRHIAGEWYFYASPWGASHFTAPGTATELTAVIGERTWNLKLKTVDLSKSVMPDDVQPQGSGTEVIATIAGKEIKAPAGGGAVSSVNGKTGVVVLGASDVNALPKTGGTIRNDDNTEPTQLYVGPDLNGLGGILQVGIDDGYASIKKGTKEVATEEQVESVSNKVKEIKSTVSTDNRFMIGGARGKATADMPTTAAIQTRVDEESEFSDEFRMDKGYDAIETATDATETVSLDKAVQTVRTHAANLVINIPAPVSGTVRDFCIYVFNQNGSTGAVTEISASDANISVFQDENDSVKWNTACPAGGEIGIYLTEIPGLGWRASRSVLKRAEDIA